MLRPENLLFPDFCLGNKKMLVQKNVGPQIILYPKKCLVHKNVG